MPTTIDIPCSKVLLPTPGELVNNFTEIINIANLLALSGYEDEAKKIMDILDKVDDALGNFPISLTKPIYGNLEIPELEWERRIEAMVQEYHIFVQVKFMEIIDKILPISFSIPVFGLDIDVVKLFSDPEYRATLKLQIAEDLEKFEKFIPEQFRRYTDDSGLQSDGLKAENIWKYLMSELTKGALGIIHGAFGALIDKFKDIWDLLGLPSLPALLTLDIEQIIEEKIASVKQQIKDAPDNVKRELEAELIEQLESISIAGFSIMDLLGGETNEYIEMAERKIERLLTRMKNFAEEWPKYLLLTWVQKIQKFLEMIGLGSLVEWITFDFCDFLKLIGLPSEISIDGTFNINSIKNPSSVSLPSLSKVTTALTGATDGSPDVYTFTTVLNQTEYGTTGGSGEVFLDGVKLATNKYTHNSTSVTLTDQPIADKILLVIE